MGTTWMHREKGLSHREFFGREFASDHKIIADATINSVWYAAIERPDGVVYGLVTLIHRAPSAHMNFGYKDMGEDMGPNACEAPAKVLDLLTPTENTYANQWRESCRKNIERKAAAPSLKGLTDGDKVRLRTPLTFTDGSERDTFEIRTSLDRGGRKQTRLYAPGGYSRFQVPRWRERVVEVIPA